ncbi:GxxExxY protein [Prosthecobacter dejongeii]|uniref:GxxExxY protein n=2 Tax=Prosthecobacter dejongeii TaxID=48465 RepID=A0A7W7YQM3_9BACT|nr:GxxExxY protein [Prosthecobacter dejongeii]
MKVHTTIGPGLGEGIYHQELAIAPTKAGISHLSKPRRDLVYQGIVADTFEPDFVIEDHFIPELKCLRGSFAAEHLVQVFCYCKFWRLRTSLLVDFGKQSLMWKRFLYRSQSTGFPETPLPDFVSAPALATTIVQAVSTCLDEVGLGYRQTTWNGLVRAALLAIGCQVHLNPTITVLSYPGITVCSLVIHGDCAVYVTALTDGINATDRATLQTHLRWLNLEWGIIFHFGKSTADLVFVKHPKKQSAYLPESAGTPSLPPIEFQHL